MHLDSLNLLTKLILAALSLSPESLNNGVSMNKHSGPVIKVDNEVIVHILNTNTSFINFKQPDLTT